MSSSEPKWVLIGLNEWEIPLSEGWKPPPPPPLRLSFNIRIRGTPLALGYSFTKWWFNLNKTFYKDARTQMSSNDPIWAQTA